MDRINLKEIAARAKVPVDQVSKVVLGQEGVAEPIRQRILQVMHELGLVADAQTRVNASQIIGVVVPGPIIDDYIGHVSKGVQEAATQFYFSTTINIQSYTRRDSLVGLIGEWHCAGVISIVPLFYEELIEMCEQYECPYILVDYQGTESLPHAPTIEANNYEATLQIMRHLFDFGHQRIGFIAGNLTTASARQRLRGYRDALEKVGITCDPSLVVEGDWSHPSAYALTRDLLAVQPRPTAIVASNDLMAFGVIQAAQEVGLKIGSDLSVTGFDDIAMAATISPSLTTVRQPTYKMGFAAMELLKQIIAGEKPRNIHLCFETEFIIRESTGPAPV